MFAVALALAPALMSGSPARAATLVVDTVVDNAALTACDAATPNDCSLRGAVIRAAGLAGLNTVEVPAGTYVLTQTTTCQWRGIVSQSGPLALSTPALCLAGNTTLVGAGADATIIDANQAAGNRGILAPVAFVDARASIEIRGVAMKRGNYSFNGTIGAGGAIRNAGVLLLVDSTVTDSFSFSNGGGIYNTGMLSLLRTTVARNSGPGDGGGIFNGTGSILVMADSRLVDNSGVNGGGLSNLYGEANITGSTISGNIGTNFGGGVYNGNVRPMFMTNTTVSGNRGRTGGGIANPQFSVLHLQNVTIANNTARWFDNPNAGIGGGLYNNLGTVTFANTLIAGNIAGQNVAPDCYGAGSGALTSQGHNLIHRTADCAVTGDTTGNVLGQDPLLGLLASNGGPTPTHAPADGSPAIDAGNPAVPGSGGTGTCAAIDQRGFLRPLGLRCDIGAFERSAAFAVAGILPATGGNTGTVSALVSGSGFTGGASVVLRQTGQPDIPAAPAVVDAGGSAIAVTFDLGGKPAGAWDVVVVNPDQTSRVLAAGFTVEAARPADLWVDVVGVVRRPGRRSQLTIIYGNRGNVDAVGVPLWLSVPKGYGVSALFPIAPPPAVAGEIRPDWNEVAPVVLTSAASEIVQVPLLLPVIPAGFTGILRIALTLPLDAQDTLILAVIGDPLLGAGLDAQFLADTVAGASAHVQQNFGIAIPPTLVPDLERYLTDQVAAIVAGGRAAFAGSLGTEAQVYSLAHLSLDLALFAVVRASSAAAAARPESWLARAYRWLLTSVHQALASTLAWLGPTEAWAAGAARGQNCGMVMGEGQSGCGGKQDNLRDILPPEIPRPPGCDPSKATEFVANKCIPTKDFCEALPGYKVVTGQGGQPFCVPERPPSSKCSQHIDNPILGSSGNMGCKIFPLRPTNSVDPNDKAGPPGAGTQQFVPAGTPMSYVVHFENLPTATGAAQVVVVTDQLDPLKVDLDTFRLGPISFGTFTLVPAPGVQRYTGGVDLRPDENLIVTVSADLDVTTGLVTWQFVSVDPDTSQLTGDPQAGFLPPNTTPPLGEGGVMFTVMPKAGLASGTEISNRARVFFDLNAPIDTPLWLNTIDTAKPTSQVLPLAVTQTSPTFSVQWSGTDGGSGIAGYTVFVSQDDGPFTELVTDTSATSAAFTGQVGSTYKFCSLARDQVGNVEDKACPPLAEAVTTVGTAGGGHDLAVVKIRAPAAVEVTPGTALTRSVSVQIQNRGTHAETLASAAILGDGQTTGLVRLKVEVIDDGTEGCRPAAIRLDTDKNATLFRRGPKILKAKARVTVAYLVTYDCASAGLRESTRPIPGDYRHTATVHHEAIDGLPDTHAADDSCPHQPQGQDPVPADVLKDTGCGVRMPDGTYGAPVTNVYRR